MFTEQINAGMNDNSPVQVPFRVTQSEFPTIVTGTPAVKLGPDGFNGNLDHVTIQVNGNRVIQVAPDNVRQSNSLDLQLSGTVQVFFTYDTPETVLSDLATQIAGGSSWIALWTEAVGAGTPVKAVSIPGNVTGLRFTGTGSAAISRL